jgi:hypothetical protein
LRKVILPAHRNARRVAGTRVSTPSDTLLLNSPVNRATAAWRRFLRRRQLERNRRQAALTWRWKSSKACSLCATAGATTLMGKSSSCWRRWSSRSDGIAQAGLARPLLAQPASNHASGPCRQTRTGHKAQGEAGVFLKDRSHN